MPCLTFEYYVNACILWRTLGSTGRQLTVPVPGERERSGSFASRRQSVLGTIHGLFCCCGNNVTLFSVVHLILNVFCRGSSMANFSETASVMIPLK